MNLDLRQSYLHVIKNSNEEDDQDQVTFNRFEFLIFFARYANEPKVHSCKRTVRDSKKFRLLFLPEEWCARAAKRVGRRIDC